MNENTILVEKMVNGGYGLARMDNGQVLLLRNSLPGETVRYEIDAKRKKTFFGRAVTILEAHRDRIVPPCPYYGKCGGCNFQHCSYQGQLALKKQIVEELFKGLETVSSPISSPKDFGYRQRIRLQVKSGKIGYMQFRSDTVIPITSCLIAAPVINAVLEAVLQSNHFKKLSGHCSEVEFHLNPATGQVTLLLHYLRPPRPNDRITAGAIAAAIDSLDRVFFIGDDFAIEGPFPPAEAGDNTAKQLCHTIVDRNNQISHTLVWEIGGFCQVNLRQNQNMIDFVLERARVQRNEKLLDLFCGMGNFSIPLAASAASLIGVEGQGSSIRCARINSETAGLDNTRFIKGDIDAICSGFNKENRIFDTIIIDPPRQGIPTLAHSLADLARQKIIYISCDPATLSRDINTLLEHGFVMIDLQPFDMFPQTHHIETVAVLEKN